MAIRERLTWKNIGLAFLWIVVLGTVGVLAYWAIWPDAAPPRTGFGQYRNEQGQLVRAKTLWDWLDLLIVPAVLAVAAYLFNRSQKQAEMAVAHDKQNHEILQHYFDKMSDLLMSTNLGALVVEDANSETREQAEMATALARTRTLAVLRSVDTGRVSAVFRFLLDTTIGDIGLDKLVSLEDGDLRSVDWEGVSLPRVNLQGALLGSANLRGAWLFRANLRGANLISANLKRANLLQADLRRVHALDVNLHVASLEGANLQNATLFRANLHGARLYRAKLQGAWLLEANLKDANLCRADLREAHLGEADLRGARLISALVTPSQLLEAKSLRGATLPDGTKYEEWVKRGKPDWPQQAEDDDAA